MPSTHGPVPSRTQCCEKSRKPPVRLAFQRRVRQGIELPTADIYEMVVFHYLGWGATQTAALDEGYVDAQAAALGQAIQEAAQREANRGMA